MSWAADRHVTLEEDMAYCLVGLFGVKMLMIYTEGRVVPAAGGSVQSYCADAAWGGWALAWARIWSVLAWKSLRESLVGKVRETGRGEMRRVML